MTIAIVLGVYMLGMLAIGWYGKKHATNFSDYLTTGKTATLIMIIGTAIGAHIGSGFVVGGSGAAAVDGFGGAWYGIGCGISYLIVSLTITKWISEKGYVTLSDYFKDRYGTTGTRLIFSVSSSLAYLGILGGQIMAGKFLFEGLGYNATLGAILCTVVVLIYSSQAGLWGAYMTSVVQTIIIGLGLILGTAVLLANGAWDVITANLTPHYFKPVPFSASVLVMTLVPVSLSCFTDQGNWQRSAAAVSSKVAVRGHLIAGLLMIPFAFLPVIFGMYGAAAYPDAPASAALFTVLLNEFPMILVAIIMAAVIAAIMSTADMSFLSISATVIHDIYKGIINPEASEQQLKKMAVILDLIVAVIALLLALSFSSIISLLSMAYTLMVSGCMIPFLGGLLWKKGTNQGALAAAATGITLTLVDYFIVTIPFASIVILIPVLIVYLIVSSATYKAPQAA